jgi:hypothetical protein
VRSVGLNSGSAGGDMLSKLVARMLRCSHSDYSFPITLKSDRFSANDERKGPHVVCLDFGQELPYDWARMQISATAARPTMAHLRQSATR